MAQRLKNEPLNNYTTFKIGGPADIISIPNDINDLLSELNYCQKHKIPFRILGKGSNILVSDKGVKGFIIKLNKACNNISKLCENEIEVGSGVSLQKFINYSINNNLGGNEMLFSIPATIGGAIYMNAGVGKPVIQSISDYIKSVKVTDGKTIYTLEKEKCGFMYRSSIFHEKKNLIIVSAVFEMFQQDKSVGTKKIDKRMNWAKKNNYFEYPSAGSIFNRDYVPAISSFMRGKKIGKAMYSKNNGNWINNLGDARFKDVLMLIRITKLLNMLLLRNAKLEIEIWK